MADRDVQRAANAQDLVEAFVDELVQGLELLARFGQLRIQRDGLALVFALEDDHAVVRGAQVLGQLGLEVAIH